MPQQTEVQGGLGPFGDVEYLRGLPMGTAARDCLITCGSGSKISLYRHRLSGSPGCPQGLRELQVKALVRRVFVNQFTQLSDDASVPSEGHGCVDAQGKRLKPLFLQPQPQSLCGGAGVRRQVYQCSSTPQPKRLVEKRTHLFKPAYRGVSRQQVRSFDEMGEPLVVEVRLVDVKTVAQRLMFEEGAARAPACDPINAEAKAVDVVVDIVSVETHARGQSFDVHGLPVPGQKVGKQRATACRGRRRVDSVHDQLHGAEKTGLGLHNDPLPSWTRRASSSR
ncbi:hypothetical protein [Streptomyces sp. B6B3]|uniref:hypothetical protein n=1 Tax=Streptomyces sp. B6B3 TaxID=3153570 RepID=UPI00325F3684